MLGYNRGHLDSLARRGVLLMEILHEIKPRVDHPPSRGVGVLTIDVRIVRTVSVGDLAMGLTKGGRAYT